MNRFGSFVCCVALVALAGCKKDATFTEPIGDFASITWANLVPDTGQLDTRVIDIPSNAGLFRAPFRSSLIYPTGIEAGTRHIKVFIHSDNPDTAKMFLVDTTLTFIANEAYSFYIAGFARSGMSPSVRVVLTPATVPAGGAGRPGHARHAIGRCHRWVDCGGHCVDGGRNTALRAGVEGAAGRVAELSRHRHNRGGSVAPHVPER